MKTKMLFILLWSALTTVAQEKPISAKQNFLGTWGAEKTPTSLTISSDTTRFTVIGNQLFLLCRNVYKHDTLLLYIAGRDCGREFNGPPWYHPPKLNSLFARCYVKDDEMHIIYAQKYFRDNKKGMGLQAILYKD